MSNLSRRNFLQLGAAAPALAASGKPKNLVFIIADQHSGTALGCTGHPIVRTPRLDGLARQGALFTHAYTGGLICAPSRACLDTGLHVQTHGVRTNGIPLRSGIENIYAILGRHGYAAPKQHSHSDVKGYLAWLRQQGYEDVASPIIGSKKEARLIPTPYRFETGRAGISKEQSLDAYTIRQSIDFIERHRERPFGLWIQLHGAHDPYVVPAPYDQMYRVADLPMPPYRTGEYDSKPARQKRTWQSQSADKLSDEHIRTILAHYLGMISQTDELVGQVLDRLAALGLDQDTIVVYTADHGDTMGCHRMFTKGFGFYEPAIRIPMIVRAPGVAKAGTRIDSMVSGVDVLPTILELMDLPKVNGLHGRSLVPLWRGTETTAHDAIFSGQDYEGATRLVMMRTAEWKLTRYDEGGSELYNTLEDPDELHNRAGESKYVSVLSRLSKGLEEWDNAYAHARPEFTPGVEPERARRLREAFDEWMAKHSA